MNLDTGTGSRSVSMATFDMSPNSSARAGVPVIDGNMVAARISKKHGTRLSVETNAENMDVQVMAGDASGNRSFARTTIRVTPE